MMFYLLPTALRSLIASLLWSDQAYEPPLTLQFRLRHEHALSDDFRTVFADVPQSFVAETFSIPSKDVQVHIPESFNSFANARMLNRCRLPSQASLWMDDVVQGPDIQKRETLLQLAMMTYNAYSDASSDWYELDGRWNNSQPFGWEPDADGLRGHVFVSDDNSTVIISIKGTSAGWMAGGGGPTTRKDKLNDNLLFSCCCARVGPTWSPVCGCYCGEYRCDQDCVEDSLNEDSLFYPVGINLYNNVSYMYPDATIWVTGHSLGGALASLIGVTFGAPVVAFEAPGEKSAARRLHLPSPPSTQHITHVYHTADPVPMGTCNGVTSYCAIAGFAMETRCHLGKVMRYDTVNRLNWSVDLRKHPIKVIIDSVLSQDWDQASGAEVPPLEDEEDCVDCFNWSYGGYRNTSYRA